MNYEMIKSNPTRSQFNETNDCTVIAAALTVGRTYEEAHAALKAEGRKHRQCAYRDQQELAIIALGGKIKFKLGSYRNPLRQPNGCKYTPGSLAKAYTKGVFYCFTRSHAFAMINGVVQDWTANRRHLVVEIWEIEPATGLTDVTPPAPEPVRVDPGKATKAEVNVIDANGTMTIHSSMKKAFEALGLYMPHHQKVRRITKLRGQCSYSGYEFKAVYK